MNPYENIDWKNLRNIALEFDPDNFDPYKDKYVVDVSDIKFKNSRDSNRALDVSYVCDDEYPKNGIYIKSHNSGWTIIGKVVQDWFVWVESFEAHHPEHGIIFGSFDKKVYSETKDAFEHFVSSHKYHEWDQSDS